MPTLSLSVNSKNPFSTRTPASAFVLHGVEEFERLAFAVAADPHRCTASEESSDVHNVETHFSWVVGIRFLVIEPLTNTSYSIADLSL